MCGGGNYRKIKTEKHANHVVYTPPLFPEGAYFKETSFSSLKPFPHFMSENPFQTNYSVINKVLEYVSNLLQNNWPL